jgi:hypothetical protein
VEIQTIFEAGIGIGIENFHFSFFDTALGLPCEKPVACCF